MHALLRPRHGAAVGAHGGAASLRALGSQGRVEAAGCLDDVLRVGSLPFLGILPTLWVGPLAGGSVPAPVQVVAPRAAASIKHLSGALVRKSRGLKALPGWAAAICGCQASAPCQADGAEVGAPGWSEAGGWWGTAGLGGDAGCAIAAGMRAAPSAAASAMPLTTSARRSSMPAPRSTPCPPPPRPRAGTRP